MASGLLNYAIKIIDVVQTLKGARRPHLPTTDALVIKKGEEFEILMQSNLSSLLKLTPTDQMQCRLII